MPGPVDNTRQTSSGQTTRKTSTQKTKVQENMWDAYRKFEGADMKDIDRKSIHTGGFSAKDINKMNESMLKYSIQNGEEGRKIYESYKEMVSILQAKDSEGGAQVTDKEQNTLYEFMLNLTGHEYRYSD